MGSARQQTPLFSILVVRRTIAPLNEKSPGRRPGLVIVTG